MNPTAEEAYWREHHERQWFAAGRTYEAFRDAYRVGYEGYGRFGRKGGEFDDYETEFRAAYERGEGGATLPWEEARQAARAAWNRLSGNLLRLLGYEVTDATGSSVGKVNNLWTDVTGEPEFLGVTTGWLFGKNHVVPVHTAEVNDRRRTIRLPFTEDQIRHAPAFDEQAEIADEDERRIREYYGIRETPRRERNAMAEEHMERQQARGEERTIRLKEEQVKVGKRGIEAGGVRLRKVVRTETVNTPVELRREEIVIERVPADQVSACDMSPSFQEEDIFIPLRREEPVVEKETRLREEVRVGKRTDIESARNRRAGAQRGTEGGAKCAVTRSLEFALLLFWNRLNFADILPTACR
ncbi:hypothetical protein DB347_12380 [Opitutaceae bacterium EW11]|nr:hypothetical protein DB347_12380 [Opitutaceae bacterium EW11]